MAKNVRTVVPRVLIIVVQKVWPTGVQDDRQLILKFDAAILKQRQSSHVVVWGGDNLSSWVWVQRTIGLGTLGSNKAVCRVPPLQMAPSGSRCLYCGVSCT